jgi:hypothetical protein
VAVVSVAGEASAAVVVSVVALAAAGVLVEAAPVAVGKPALIGFSDTKNYGGQDCNTRSIE